MKIISLTMNAFLAYKDKTTIDFESMIDHGLYLISGPTGAGKTTIFDAITFALYGEASGSERSQSYLRSDFADAKEETYVEMTFEIHGEIYTIKRSPTYMRLGYKTPKLSNAYFTHKQITIEGVKEVNQKINNLLGVDVKQFKQIVMIAQGEFTKLIYASSEERERVLRHIFHSESLVTFENILREETKSYKEQYLFSNQQLLTRFQLLSLSDDFIRTHTENFHPSYIEEALNENKEIDEQRVKAKKVYDSLKQQCDECSKTYYSKQKQNQDIIDYQKIDNQYHTLTSNKKEINDLKKDIDHLKILEQNQSMIDQYQKTNNELTINEKEYQQFITKQKETQTLFNEIEKEYKNIPLYQHNKEKLLLTIENTRQAIDKQKTYQQLIKQEETISNEYLSLQKKYIEFQEEHNKLLKRIERDQENTSHLTKLQLELSLSEQKVNEMNQRRISIHELSDHFDHYTHLQDEHYELGKKYKQVSDAYLNIQDRYQKEDENFRCQQAGILAATLVQQQPCPVCGSLVHPHPATISKDILTPKQLEELYQDVEMSQARKDEVYQEVLIQNQNVQEIKTQIELLKKQLEIDSDLSKEIFIQLLADMSQYINEQEKTYQKKQIEVEYLKKVKSSLEKDQIVLNKNNALIEEYKTNLHSLEIQQTTLKTQIKEYLKQDQLINSKSLDFELIKHEEELKELSLLLDTMSQNFNQCQKDLSIITTQLEINRKRNKELVSHSSLLEKQYIDLVKKKFRDEDELLQYQLILYTLIDKEQTYQDYLIQEKTLSSRLKELKVLIKDKQLVDLSLEEEKLKRLEKDRDNVFKEMNELVHTFEQNASLIKILEKEYRKNQDIFEKYTRYQDLLDMASGKNSQRLSFERYVLSSYFEHILEYANIELLKMSQGRYTMHRKQMTKGAKQQGLDLSVLDYETGMMRDIQSLSGGESFKAALALALGLSSMIQSYAGGIELNTLFIDEGFGSLDSESIDQALSVLLDLKNDNKVIGIISHVNELKERITSQIVVDKTKNGSRLHIEKE